MVSFDGSDLRQLQINDLFIFRTIGGQPLVLEFGQYFFEKGPSENGHDGRRRFICAKSVVIACAGETGPQQIAVIVYRFDHIDEEGQELQVRARIIARGQKILSIAGRHRPVIVLSASIETRKGLGEYMQRGSAQRPTGSVIPDAPIISHGKDWGAVDAATRAAIHAERLKRQPGFKAGGKSKGNKGRKKR